MLRLSPLQGCSGDPGGCSGFYLLVVGLTFWSPSFAINNILVQPITNAHADTHMNLGLLLLRLYPGQFITCLCHLRLFITLPPPLPPILLCFFFFSHFLSLVRSVRYI